MRKVDIKFIPQTEEKSNERTMGEEETKEFLYKYHPEIYKQMYPEKVVPKKKVETPQPQPHQKREGNDIQKTDNVYTYNKYSSAQLNDQNDFNFNIEIKTDMKFKR